MNKYMLIGEGFASRTSVDNKTLSHYILPIILKKYNIKEWIQTQSSRILGILNPSAKRRNRKFLKAHNKNGNELLLFTKSYNCVLIYRDLINHYDKYFKNFDKITWICIDGYSVFGYGKNKPFHKPKGMDNLTVYNFYQRNGTKKKNCKYRGNLKGAMFVNADKNIKLDTTHMDIVKDDFLLKTVEWSV